MMPFTQNSRNCKLIQQQRGNQWLHGRGEGQEREITKKCLEIFESGGCVHCLDCGIVP